MSTGVDIFLADFFTHLKSVYFRKHDIENYEIVLFAFGEMVTFFAIKRLINGEAILTNPF